MTIIRNILQIPSDPWEDGRVVAALGNFDGLHTAHRELILTAVQMAEEQHAASAVFTFATSKGAYLTDLGEKLAEIERLGVDFAFVADFSELCSLTPEAFVHRVLHDRMHCAAVVCGYNFRFGASAAGDVSALERLCGAQGIETRVLEPIVRDGRVVSSTEIRNFVREGAVDRAALFLGRPFALTGVISHGRQVGRRMNCPTLNLPIAKDAVCPRWGVYFARCSIGGGEDCPSICNIGVRPTFDESCGESEPLCEVHLLVCPKNLADPDRMYGQPLRVKLDSFRRPEQRFASPEELYHQIASDIDAAKRFYQSKDQTLERTVGNE